MISSERDAGFDRAIEREAEEDEEFNRAINASMRE